MKNTKHILFIVTLLCNALLFAQQPEREDDSGDVSDVFQENFFNAIQQKGIENYDKAVDLLINCLAENTNEASVYFELGKNYFKLDKLQLAADALQKANTLKPNNEWILYAMYQLQKTTKNQQKTVEVLKKLIVLKPKYKEELVKQYYSSKNYKEALQVINDLDVTLGITKKRENLRYAIYGHQKKQDKIVAYINKKINKETAKLTDYTRLIYTYSILKNNKKGYETAIAFKEAYPNSPHPYLSLYKYYQTQGKINDVVFALHKVTIAGSLLSVREKQKVLNDFYKFTAKNLQYLPELEKALKAAAYPSLSNKMIHLYEATNNTQKINEILAKASDSKVAKFSDLKILIQLFLDKKKPNKALISATKALNLYPAQSIFYLQQATALNLINLPKKAIESLTFGLDYIIENPKMETNFYMQMAKSYELLGNTKKQKNYLKKAKQ